MAEVLLLEAEAVEVVVVSPSEMGHVLALDLWPCCIDGKVWRGVGPSALRGEPEIPTRE